jgi:hypothetical protein
VWTRERGPPSALTYHFIIFQEDLRVIRLDTFFPLQTPASQAVLHLLPDLNFLLLVNVTSLISACWINCKMISTPLALLPTGSPVPLPLLLLLTTPLSTSTLSSPWPPPCPARTLTRCPTSKHILYLGTHDKHNQSINSIRPGLAVAVEKYSKTVFNQNIHIHR